MREICMSGSMSEVWKQSHGRASEAPPNERGGNRYVRPTATAPHLDSTDSGGPIAVAGMTAFGVRRDKAALSRSYGATGTVPLRFRFAKHELNGDRDVDLSAGACRPRRDCHAFCRV